VKTWDVRCSLPLYTTRAQKKGGEEDGKGLAVVYGEGAVFVGGSDCEVKKF